MNKQQTLKKSRYLRHEETDAEKVLWNELRNRKLGTKFRRQHPIGRFILDFYAPKAKLVIEIDGMLHKESKEYDRMRTEFLNAKRIEVLRFWNSDIDKDLRGVLKKITLSISARNGEGAR